MAESRRPECRVLAFHQHPHLDEIGARVIFLLEGQSSYSWSADSPPEAAFFMNDTGFMACVQGRSDVVAIGLAHGLFDEHHQDGSRIHGECAATLLAKFLRVDECAKYRMLLGELLRCDTQPGIDNAHVANVVKLLHAHADGNGEPEQDLRVMNAFGRMLEALVDRESGKEPVRALPELAIDPEEVNLPQPSVADAKPVVRHLVAPAYASFPTLVKLWMVQAYGHNRFETPAGVQVHLVDSFDDEYAWLLEQDDVVFVGIEGGQYSPSMSPKVCAKSLGCSYGALEKLLQCAQKAYTQPEECELLHIANAVELLNLFAAVEPEQIWLLVRVICRAFRASGQSFAACEEEFEAGGVCQPVSDVQVALVTSDNPDMHKWCRKRKGAKVVVQRRRSGNVNIFTENGVGERVMPSIAAEVLKAELVLRSASAEDVESALGALEALIAEKGSGDLPGCSGWHLHASNLHNGTTTHEAVATSLTNEVLVRAVATGIRKAMAK